MKLADKLIQTLYEIVIYVFPFLILLFILVSFQLWKLEDTKEIMTKRLHNSTEMIEAAKTELNAIRNGLVSANDSFAYHSIAFADRSGLTGLFPTDTQKQVLVELGINVLNRVAELKNDSINYRLQKYVITEPTNRYYAVVISYSELGYAIIQRENLMSFGFRNIKILETEKLYALSIDDASEKKDIRLTKALEKWNSIFGTQSDAYIKKF